MKKYILVIIFSLGIIGFAQAIEPIKYSTGNFNIFGSVDCKDGKLTVDILMLVKNQTPHSGWGTLNKWNLDISTGTKETIDCNGLLHIRNLELEYDQKQRWPNSR